jgi:hypothetical protein
MIASTSDSGALNTAVTIQAYGEPLMMKFLQKNNKYQPSRRLHSLFVWGALVCVECCPTAVGSLDRSVPKKKHSPMRRLDNAPGLKLTIAPNDYPQCQTVCIEATIGIINITESFWMNVDFGPTFSTTSRGSLELEVRDVATGKERKTSCMVNPARHLVSQYIEFVSGTQIKRVFDIGCYTLPESTRWKVVAHYRDKNTEPPEGPIHTPWFTGELTSNEIIVEGTGSPREKEMARSRHKTDSNSNADSGAPH